MSTSFLCDGPVTEEMVEKMLQEFFHTKATLAKCEGIVISKGMGFTSEVMRVKLEWNHDPKNGKVPEILPDKVIVKAPLVKCIESIFKNMSMNNGAEIAEQPQMCEDMMQMIHKTECEVYKVLHMAVPPPVPFPLIYGIRERDVGMIIMEDLSDRAGIVENIAIGLTLNQWRSIVIHLANLHAWSLTTDIDWRNRVPGPDAMIQLFASWVEMTKSSLKMHKEKFSDAFGHVDETLFEKEISLDNLKHSYDLYRQVLPDVMQHGDTWSNNIMLQRDPENPSHLTDKVEAFIDWQISAAGCGLNDVARIACWSVPHELRRSHENEILKLYFDQFCKRAGPKLGNHVTFEGASKAFSHISAINGLLGVTFTDFALTFIVKVNEDPSGQRQSEMLARTKAGYDDAAAYFKNRHDNCITEL